MDFLKSFVSDADGSTGGHTHSLKEESFREENVELSLGLSLNGRFGLERRTVAANGKYDDNKLIRASSVADFSSLTLAKEGPTSSTVYPPLTRTCSLPVETEEEWKKRKELQSLRRSEAKRKRVEKLKNVKVVRGFSTEDNNYETKRRNIMNGNELGISSPPSPLPPLPRQSHFPSPATVGSPPSGGSSGVSDMESQPFSGANKDSELKSTASQHSGSNLVSGSGIYRSNSVASESRVVTRNEETLKMMLADMPCVSTKGNGLNGKKINGFLYRYRKGQEVRIVCVCHGSFLTPAEFVKHGGGDDVEHPLRHIVVNPPSF